MFFYLSLVFYGYSLLLSDSCSIFLNIKILWEKIKKCSITASFYKFYDKLKGRDIKIEWDREKKTLGKDKKTDSEDIINCIISRWDWFFKIFA